MNGGTGAPADEAFVATKMTVVEGSKAFTLNVDECVASAKSMYKTYQKEHAKELDAELAKAMKDALGDRKATGPRESQDLMHITWMTKDRRLAVTFQSTVTDGAYRNGGGANFDGEVGRGAPGPVGPKPPPPLELGGRWGTQFGMVFGRSYEFDTSGASLGTKTLAAEGFKKELPPPPGARNPPALPVLDPPALPVIPPKKGD